MNPFHWVVVFAPAAEKEFKKLGFAEQKYISKFIDEKLSISSTPQALGKQLKGALKGYWSFRVSDYRMIVVFITADHIADIL